MRTYECDSYGHANNAVYLNYLEYARMEALNRKGLSLKKMKQMGFLIVVRRIEIDYRLSHIKFHKVRGRRLYCNTPMTDNAVKFNM